MASDLVLLLLKLNLAAGAAILVVIALRRVMRAWFGARAAYGLWLAVPFAMLAVMLPPRTVEVFLAAAPATTSVVAPVAGVEARPAIGVALDWPSVAVVVWLTGVAAMLALLAWRQQAFVASLGRLSREPGPSRMVRAEATGMGPAILGALWPKLILPRDFEARFDAEERELVLAHERVHLKGGDARINGLVVLAQCVCWFNPLVHVAARLMRVDQELACDAAVAARFPQARRAYAQAMLKTQIAQIGLPVGCYWPAKGEHPLKLRIAMLKRGLPGELRAAWGAVAAGLACLATGCVVYVGQPPREVAATSTGISAPVSPEQAKKDDRLLRAVWSGGTGFAKAALESGANVDARNSDGLTSLIIAARADDMQLVNLLLAHGADVHLTSPGEGNALAAAARRGQLRAVKALVEHGARVNDVVPDIGTPLAASVRTGQLTTVKYLVEQGADLNLPSPPQAPWDRWGVQRTPLAWAVNGDHIAIAKFLRSQGATM
jgi:beta-lactamase regulating signal transducer with metallopeptidase domain